MRERPSNPHRTPDDLPVPLALYPLLPAPPPVRPAPPAPSFPGPVEFAALAGFTPDPVQSELLCSPAHRLLLNCTRQWGKTTVCALKALHFALARPGVQVLAAAPTHRQSTLFLNKAASFLRALRLPIQPLPALDRSLLLPNSSSIVSLPGRADSVRGFTAHLLILDEAARLPRPLIEALTPTLAATDGPLWLLSTPAGHGNLFYDFWHDDAGPWTRFRVPATACPRLSPAFLEAQRLLLGGSAFRQEYLCEFTQDPAAFFPADLLDAALEPFFGGKPLW